MEGAGDNGVLLVAMGTVATLGAPHARQTLLCCAVWSCAGGCQRMGVSFMSGS